MNEHKEKQSSKSKRRKVYGVIAFVLVIIIVFIIVMTRSRPDWRAIGFGTLAFLFGSAALVWTEERKSELWKWLKGIFVPIILAAGGLLTTHGWNLRDNYFNDRARLVAMAAELNLNRMCVDLLSLSYDEYKTTNNQEEMTALSLPSTHQVRQVLNFSDIQQNDANLADIVFEYVFAADLLNAKLVQIDRVCSNHVVSRKMVKDIIQSTFGEECIFDVFRNLHKKLVGHLVAKYGWCYEEASIKIRKPMVDNFYRAIASRYIQLNSFEHQRRMKRLRDIMQQQGISVPIPNEDSSRQSGQDPNCR
jgi:hypothetical protein